MDTEGRETAEKLKDEGNKLFQQKEFEKAISSYQNALRFLHQENKEMHVTILSNICASLICLQRYEECVEVANKGLHISPTHTKLIYRKCIALQELRQYNMALEALKKLNTHTNETLALESQIYDKLKIQDQSYIDCLNGILSTASSLTLSTGGLFAE